MSAPQNVDQQEIAHFDRISELWWDPKGKMGMLHKINPLRSQFIFEQVRAENPKAMDIGCGGGILTEALAKHGMQANGIDQSEFTLNIAIKHAKENGLDINYRLITAEEIADEEAGQYDVVACLEMMEHVPDPAAIVAACSKLLKPNGIAVFSTINRTFKAWLTAIIIGEYVMRILPKGTHQYEKLIKPSEMKQWAEQSGLEHLRTASLMFNPLFKSWKVVEGKEDTNYMMSFRKKG